MALVAKVIKQKIKSVGNIKKITKTMEMVSASKMRRAVSRALGARLYATYASELLTHLSSERDIVHPLMVERNKGKGLLVIVASNKGLCGGYNTQVSKMVHSIIKNNPNTTYEVITIGKQAEKIARRHSLSIVASFLDMGEIISPEDISGLRSVLLDTYTSTSDYRFISVVSTVFHAPLQYNVVVKQVLPLQSKDIVDMSTEETSVAQESPLSPLYILEPSGEAIADQIIPQLLGVTLFQVMVDALASEHSSRMVAMKNATENAKTMQDELTLTYNKARQAGITQEIAEISAGANAL
jgi:F-type H+-transporting ATPase subunit gamma